MPFQFIFLVFVLVFDLSQESAVRDSTDIDDGWYTATVQYHNSNTYTRSTYTLDVKVQYNRVVEIDFGNGGSVHSGYNDSGYQYSGGHLYFERDYNQKVVAATTTVRVTTENYTVLTCGIRIE